MKVTLKGALQQTDINPPKIIKVILKTLSYLDPLGPILYLALFFYVTGVRHIERLKSKGNWENVDVMFDDNKTIEELTKTKNDDSDSSNSTPGKAK